MKLKACAKINPALFVTGRRPDGYHEVDMIMQTISLHDEVTVELTDDPGIHLTMNTEALPTDERNIAYRAAAVMLDEYKKRSVILAPDNADEEKYLSDNKEFVSTPPKNEKRRGSQGESVPGIRIHIEKRIPVAAGMAGGSTDCAAVIKALNVLFNLNLSVEELNKIGVKLGADVPFCIQGGTMRSQGIGEILTEVSPMPECYILTAKPDYSVSTREVYEGIDREIGVYEDDPCMKGKTAHNGYSIGSILNGFNNCDLAVISGSMYNDLEKYTLRIHPDLEELKKIMLSEGALGALMSGSGPTVFGIFGDMQTAEKAKKRIISLIPGSTVDISVPLNE